MASNSKKSSAAKQEVIPVFPKKHYHVGGLEPCPQRAAVAVMTRGNKPVAVVWSKKPQPALPSHVEELRRDSPNVYNRMRNLLGVHIGKGLRLFRTTMGRMVAAASSWRGACGSSRYHDWSKGIDTAVNNCHDMTGQEFVVYEADAEHGPGQRILGTEARVLLAVGQVEDEDGIVEIQHAYDMCKHVFSAATGRLKNDHKTSMVGKAMIHTNPAAVALGYATQLKQMTAPSICDKVDPNDREVKALAEVVWKVVVKKFPFLEEYRDKVLSKLTKNFAVLGMTATNIIAKSTNTTIKMHVDTNDGPLSIILWLYGGDKDKAGGIKGGHFCALDIGVKFIPLRCTVAVMRTNLITHGTTHLQAWGGAYRVGSSHFLRVQDARSAIALSKNVGRLTSAAVRTGLDEIIGGSKPAAAAEKVKFLPPGRKGDMGCYEFQVMRDVAVRDNPTVATDVREFFTRLRSKAMREAGRIDVTTGPKAAKGVFWKVYAKEPGQSRGGRKRQRSGAEADG